MVCISILLYVACIPGQDALQVLDHNQLIESAGTSTLNNSMEYVSNSLCSIWAETRKYLLCPQFLAIIALPIQIIFRGSV